MATTSAQRDHQGAFHMAHPIVAPRHGRMDSAATILEWAWRAWLAFISGSCPSGSPPLTKLMRAHAFDPWTHEGNTVLSADAPSLVLEPAAQTFVEATANPPYVFGLGPIEGRETEDATVPGRPAGGASVRILRPKGARGSRLSVGM
jgi:hypothetical protein